jgi:6-methylsalicylate decarboxylase
LEADRELNKKLGIKTAILSITAPGPTIEPDPIASAKLARDLNLAGAAIRDSAPEEYGFFASVPSLLDTERALEEIAYALDTLKADGIVLFTRYGDDNHYLGHPDFRPIWEDLNRRKTVVFIHPTHAVDTHLVNPSLPQPMFDYPHETGRTAIDLILSNTVATTAKDCKMILSHAGGTLPYLIYRVAAMIPYTPRHINKSTEQIVDEASRFYFDTAISANEITFAALFKLARKGHVLFGSDFPNAPREGIEWFTGQFDGFAEGLGLERRRDLESGNAERLFG